MWFHFDDCDFTIDTPNGKNQLHGGLITVFQKVSNYHAFPYHVNINLKSKTMQSPQYHKTKTNEL